jgi:hypothetical protein
MARHVRRDLRPLRLVAKFALTLGCAFLLLEAVTRVMLFSSISGGGAAVSELRRATNFAHPEEDLYWWLRVRFEEGAGPQPMKTYHPELGWTPWPTDDFAHPDEEEVGGRRPVLLYGDSFSACTTPPEDCFQGLMDDDPLGADYALLNFGAFAYGVDQTGLLIERSVDRYLDRDPVVVVGVLVDRDLDRAGLAFRGVQNKPRFEFEAGELVLVPPRGNGTMPPTPFALLGSRLAVHTIPVPEPVHDLFCDRRSIIERNKVRCRLLLESLVEGLERRGLESFFLLFHSRETLDARTWEDELITRTLDDLGARWIAARPFLLDHARESDRDWGDYFGPSDHFNALGNFVAFRALRTGLVGSTAAGQQVSWADAELAGPLSPAHFERVEVQGRGGDIRYQWGAREAFGSNAPAALFFAVGRKGPSSVHYDLGQRASEFSATVRFHSMERVVDEGSVVLTAVADGIELARIPLRRIDPPHALRVDLSGRDRFTLRVDDAGDGTRGDWLLLTTPRFSPAR